ncbi:hypothetical protein EST38_g6150 [Candolleomyces aberdarensis]|uniref:Uncharacterized protein n=1 Tax=Candolleomyces aberdarensis TaxID=2316362 RepID=A0A4Q2DLS2_9AGAR|nr:hypothetical protein EST38_g6150 [Candolleomyces aberdarensis]
MNLTQELHIIRAHHLHYSSLLEDFRKTVEFIRDTENPALADLSEEERDWSLTIMARETSNLLGEILRLEKSRRMQDRRLRNVMNLVFSSVNIDDSKRMHKMAEATVRDSAAMKQIAYLTMVFLPASFIATVFGMNVKEIVPDSLGTIGNYLAAALSMTLATAWAIIAFQSKHHFSPGTPLWKRFNWPFVLLKRRFWPDSKTDDNEEPADIEIKEEIVEVAHTSTQDDKKWKDA